MAGDMPSKEPPEAHHTHRTSTPTARNPRPPEWLLSSIKDTYRTPTPPTTNSSPPDHQRTPHRSVPYSPASAFHQPAQLISAISQKKEIPGRNISLSTPSSPSPSPGTPQNLHCQAPTAPLLLIRLNTHVQLIGMGASSPLCTCLGGEQGLLKMAWRRDDRGFEQKRRFDGRCPGCVRMLLRWLR